jgi:hypothetical protein
LLLPPVLRSTSASDNVQGSGANHCFISSGCVQHLNSFSRGASISRVSTRSLFVAGAFWAVSFMILLR